MIEMGWVLLWYIGSLLLGIITFPIAYSICTSFADRGYAISRILGLTLAGLIVYLTSKIGIYVAFSWPASLLIIAGISGWIAKKNWNELSSYIKQNWKVFFTLELLFLAAFVFFSFVRSLTPAISGGEKFMDFGIFNSAQRVDVLPLYDIWISGEPLRYYWFGHLFLGQFSKMLGTPPGFGYNLSMVLLFSMTVIIAYSLGMALTKKWYWAIWAVAFIAIFGNFAGAVQILGRHWEKYDFWSPTRVIDGKISGTINEFPFFTFFFADLHAHAIAIPMVLALLYIFLQLYREGPNWKNGVLSTILLACIRVTNAWDWPALSATLGLLLFARWWRTDRKQSVLKSIVLPWMLITGASFAIFIGWPQPQPLDVKLATLRSNIKEWLMVFGAFFVIVTAYIISNFRWASWTILALILVGMATLPVWMWMGLFIILMAYLFFAQKPQQELSYGMILTISACCILAGMELVYLHDWLANSWQRMNTVFKFGLHSWYLLSMATPVLIAAAWQNTEKKKLILACVLGILILAGLVYPAIVLSQRYKWSPGLTLYGLKELYEKHPGDYDGVMWLTEQPGAPVIVEAPGDAYKYNGRISSYTGLPTVSGWPGHLFQHGVPWDVIFKRREDVKLIYNSTTIETAMPLLKKYNVTYLYVGEEERRQFNASSLAKFSSLPVAYQSQDTVIYRVG